jgi:hypothetical protein
MNKTRIILLILSLTIITGIAVSAAEPDDKLDYVCGDSNRDGRVNLVDILYMIEHLYNDPAGPEPDPFQSGDANADGTLNLLDILYLIEYIYGSPRGPEPVCELNLGPPQGELAWNSGCKSFLEKMDPGPVSDTMDCLEYQYDGRGNLVINHINGGLNCCPVVLAEIEINGHNIIIDEIDSLDNGGCYCLCLFDFTYEFENIEPGTYTIRVIEPYKPDGDEDLVITVDLVGEVSGMECVVRTEYPWLEF